MYNKDKEIHELEMEKKILQYKNDTYQESLAKSLKDDGLGDEIIKTLRKPVKQSKINILRVKINKIIKSIFDVL